jgi:hypothetical protein
MPQVNVAMTTSKTGPTKQPTHFSRGCLMLTYDFIRPLQPGLALSIRNITGGQPLPKPASQTSGKNSDYFLVALEPAQIRRIVEILMQSSRLPGTDRGRTIMANTLLDDWLRLADSMLKDLRSPPAEEPH